MGRETAPILLFIRSVLEDIFTKDTHPQAPPEISPIPSAIGTPFGIYRYPGIHRLVFISVPYIDENGSVGRIQMRTAYLDIILDKIAGRLKLSVSDLAKSLANYSRTAIIGALVTDRPALFYSDFYEQALSYLPYPQADCEYYPCYEQTTKDPDQIDNMRRLEATVEYCLQNHLNALPASVLDGWRTDFLQPIMAHIKSKFEGTDKGVST